MSESVLQQARSLFGSTLKLNEETLPVVELALCVCVSAPHPKNTLGQWAYIVGPPSCGKSMIFEAVMGVGNAEKETSGHFIQADDFSEKGFISGLQDKNDPEKDYSLLPKLDRKVLLTHEFAAISGMKEEHMRRWLGQFSGIYDAKRGYVKRLGTGSHGAADGVTFNCLLGSTPPIDEFLIYHSGIGTRFIVGRFYVDERYADQTAENALRKMSSRDTVHEELQNFVRERVKPLCDSLADRDQLVVSSQTPELEKYLLAVTKLGAKARCIPPRLLYSRNPRLFGAVSQEEVHSRLVQQINAVGWTRAYLDGRSLWNDADLAFARRVVWDTIPFLGQLLLVILHRKDDQTLRGINDQLEFEVPRTLAILQQYSAADLVDYRFEKGVLDGKLWRLSDYARETLDATWGSYSWWPKITLTRGVEKAWKRLTKSYSKP